MNFLPWIGGSRESLLNAVNAVAPLAAGVTCLVTARRAPSRRHRWTWGLIATALFASAVAEAIWAYYALILRVEPPWPSVADIPWLLFYPLTFAGLLLFGQDRGRLSSWAASLDALIFTLGMAGLSWELLLAPSLEEGLNWLGVAVVVGYPVGDLLLVFALVSLYLTWRLDRVPLAALVLLAAFVIETVADLGYAVLAMQGAYVVGSVFDWMWTLQYVLAGLAALAYLHSTALAETHGEEHAESVASLNLEWSRSARILLPYLAIPAVAVFAYLTLRTRPSDLRLALTLAFVGSIVTLVMVRQFLTLYENGRLSRSLTDLSRSLERRVAERTADLSERTEQLTVLNRAATTLSHCLTSDDALRSGLGLALDALDSDTAAIWLCDPGERQTLPDQPAIATSRGGASQALRRPDRLLEEVLHKRVPVWPRADDPGGSTNSVGLPLLSRDQIIGTLVLARGASRPWSEADRQLAESLSSQLAVTFEGARSYDSARYQADRDALTGLLNHRRIHERLDQEVARAARAGGTFSLLMMDLDNFKLFNDTYGHPMGDQVLRDVSAHLASCLREADTLGRYGGDELLAILPDTPTRGAEELAARVRTTLRQNPYMGECAAVPIRLSFGVATFPEDGHKGNELVAIADGNLYASKRQGGDTVTSADSTDDDGLSRMGTFGVLDGLVTAVDAKDRYTRQHSEDVTEHALALARIEGFSQESLNTLRVAGLLHDVGKIGVPDGILRKPGALTEDEYAAVKQHATLSELIIKEVPHLAEVQAAVGSHHERYDGMGYPRGLRGKDIPLLGRILAIADCYSAMTTDRPYRQALDPQMAREELLRVAGSQLDPDLVADFLVALDEAAQKSRPSD